MKILIKLIVILSIIFFTGVVNAKTPPNGMVMLEVSVLHNVTSKTPADDISLTFEDLIKDGINGVEFRNVTFGKGRQDYSQSEWVHEAHEYGLWVSGNFTGFDNTETMLGSVRGLSSMGVDMILIEVPFMGWEGGCESYSDAPFTEVRYTALQNNAKAASPRGECPISIIDVGCNYKVTGWNGLDGLFQELFNDSYYTSYYPQIFTFKNNHPDKFAGVSLWITVLDQQTVDTPLPDDRFGTWFTEAYNNVGNILLFHFNKKSRGSSGDWGTDWAKKTPIIRSVTKKGETIPEWRNFSPGTAVARSAPDCQVQVRSAFAGLDPDSVECYYAVDEVVQNNTKWIKHDNVSAIGTVGTKDWVTITARGVPFNKISSTLNKVMFKIKDKYTGTYHRGPRIWKKQFTVPVSALDWTNLGNEGVVTSIPATMSIKVISAKGLDVSSVVCEYTTDGGNTWIAHPAECTGTTGSTTKETVTVTAVPFEETTGKLNKIRFFIMGGTDTLSSAVYPVKVQLPPQIANLSTTRTADNLDIALELSDIGGLRLGSQESVLKDETIVLLHLDNNTDDASGNGFNGTLHGDAKFVDHESWKTNGGQEKMLYLDGDNDYLDMGFGAFGRGHAFTVSLWVKAENDKTIFVMGGHDEKGSLQMWGLSNKISVSTWDINRKRTNIATPAGSFAHNVWKHVAFTYDGSKGRIYIDGKLEITQDLSGYKMFKFKPFRIGHPVNRWEHFKGYIDEVQVVSRDLSAMEIGAEYFSGSYQYSGDGGVSWSGWKPGVFDKGDGAKDVVHMTATGLALSDKPDSLNRIQVAVRDVNGTIGSREYVLLENDVIHVESGNIQVDEISLFPNPFHNMTKVSFSLKTTQAVKLDIYGIDGKMVRTFKSRILKPGTHSITWDGQKDDGKILRAGQYFAKVKIGEKVMVKRMIKLN
ncbi:MAG: T9SS type A sorting domain-containing protein [Fibrobacteria bacterium]|nr:T9SS type A sorting domain-containing protein [Fibrobacteria bacterium]